MTFQGLTEVLLVPVTGHSAGLAVTAPSREIRQGGGCVSWAMVYSGRVWYVQLQLCRFRLACSRCAADADAINIFEKKNIPLRACCTPASASRFEAFAALRGRKCHLGPG